MAVPTEVAIWEEVDAAADRIERHLPAVNTPQFSWCKTALPDHPQPVPPIYQPEIAADRIVDVVFDMRRSSVRGSWNRIIVGGAKIVPSVFSHFAALTAVDGQQTDEPVDPDRPANLRSPADDHEAWSARGDFDDRARGVLDPIFLRSMPEVGLSLCRAIADTVGAKLGDPARRNALEVRLSADSGNRIAADEVREPSAPSPSEPRR